MYDNKMTLLEYLKKIENALKEEKLIDIQVVQPGINKAYFRFIFENGTTIDTPPINLPAGPQGKPGINGQDGKDGKDGADGAPGEPGTPGVSVIDASIDANNDLIITLSSGEIINAGNVVGFKIINLGDWDVREGSFTVTAEQLAIIVAEQYDVMLKYSHPEGDVRRTVYMRLTTKHPSTVTPGVMLYDFTTIVNGNYYYLAQVASNGNGYVYGSSIEITIANIKSSGAPQGKVLTSNGSGGTSWEDAGGSKLYCHNIRCLKTGTTIQFTFTILNNTSTEITTSTLANELNKISGYYMNATGYYYDNTDNYIIYGVGYSNGQCTTIMYNLSTHTIVVQSHIITQLSVSDKVIQL